MIIVSQDKEVIINFDNVENIWINNPLIKDEDKFEIRAESYSNNMLIGEYETQERAKEILQEIIKTHKISESYKYTRDVGLQSALTADIEMRNLILFRYEMPKE